ncbi:MAG TPA: alpha/beta fold hydrolase [Casimicrobiaceae bacterium]|nr:alpha/beta fold hydrolase [Casimicrobiaceae bacterium]
MPEPLIEVRKRLPATAAGKAPLLFVHGGYCDAWFFEPYFLPWFAAHGHAAYALSLRGHGKSGGRDALFVTSLDDYEADVERVVGELDEPPVLVGHSMGAAIVERIVAKRPVRGAALLAPLPPAGLLSIATRLAASHPNFLMQFGKTDPSKLSAEVLNALRPFYFSDDVSPVILAQAARHFNAESPRALLDLSLRLHWALPPPDRRSSVFVLGAEGDRICSPEDVRATARHHNVEAVIVPGLAHMLMLEPGWKTVCEALADWLASTTLLL